MTTSPIHGVTADYADHWTSLAACLDHNPEIWYPDHKDTEGRRYAQRICSTCPVRFDCLERALELEGQSSAGYRYGVWGGLSPSQRVAVAARRAGR